VLGLGSMDPVTILGTSLRAVGTIVVMAGGGAYLKYKGVMTPQVSKGLSEISMSLTIPCLLFTTAIHCEQNETTQPCPFLGESLRYGWPMFFLPILYVGCGLVVGSVVSRLSNADASFRFTAIAAVTFGNSTGLPITLLSVVYSTAPASSPISNMDPLLFLSVYLVMYPVLQWSVGAWLLTPRPRPDVTPLGSDSFVVEEKLSVLFTPEQPIYTLMPAGWEAVGDAPAQQRTGSQSWTARMPSTGSQSWTARMPSTGSQSLTARMPSTGSQSLTARLPPQETDSETHTASPRRCHSWTAAPPNGTEMKLAQIQSEAEIVGGSSCAPDSEGSSGENLLHAQSPLSSPKALRPTVAAVARVPRRKKLITAFQRIFPPPVLGALLGLIFALFPAGRSLLVDMDRDGGALFGWLYAGLYKIGRAAVPMNMLILGNSIAKKPSRGVISPAVAISVAFAKMVVMPTIGLFVGYTLKAFQVVPGPTGPSFYLVAMIVTATPTANNVMVMAELAGEHKQGLAVCIFLQYIVSPLLLTAWLSVYVVVATSS